MRTRQTSARDSVPLFTTTVQRLRGDRSTQSVLRYTRHPRGGAAQHSPPLCDNRASALTITPPSPASAR
eukprot:5071623-Prymnesium_polylepis.1